MEKIIIEFDKNNCMGCHACEIACKQEHSRPPEEYGILVKQVEPEIAGGKLYYLPFPTDNCNLCGKRIAKDLQPACVKHCWAGAMRFGTIEKLAEHMQEKSRTVLLAPH